MTIFLIALWVATTGAAFAAGYKLRKPIGRAQDRVKAAVEGKVHETADKIVEAVRDMEGKV